MKKKLIVLLACIPALSVCIFPALAHSGGTDSRGGHYNRSTGEYHFHHGYPEHDHYDMNGDGVVDCPYDFEDRTGSNSGSRTSSSSSYGDGYDKGYSNGLRDGTSKGYDSGYADGKESGYESGYDDGQKEMKEEMTVEMEAKIVEERKSATEIACMTSLFLGSPVVAVITSILSTKPYRKQEKELNDKIAKVREDLRRSQNTVALLRSGGKDDLADIPEDVTLQVSCLPVKGHPSPNRPYGGFTVYTTAAGRKYHYKCGCSNAYKPIHFFDLPSELEPCKNCVPKEMHPQPVPEWYRNLFK